MEVLLIYFRASGKYANEGTFTTEEKALYEIWEEVAVKAEKGTLPGLIEGTHVAYISVDVPAHPHNHPHLIVVGKEE